MKVTYLNSAEGAFNYYRSHLPLSTANKKKAALCERVMPGMLMFDREFNPGKYERYFDADIIQMPNLMSTDFYSSVREAAKIFNPACKFVVDFDDDIFNVSPFSPAYSKYGVEEFSIKAADGSVLPMWQDGKNMCIQENKKKLDDAKAILSEVDLLTVTTDELRKAYEPYCSRIEVIPNCIDVNLWERWPHSGDESVRLFWSGGSSHFEDILILKDVIPAIFDKYPKAKLVLMGYICKPLIASLPSDRVEIIDWCDIAMHPFIQSKARPDIGLIPLRDNTFNRGKSALKWMELSAMETPCVMSNVTPYREMRELSGDDIGVYVENTKDSWVAGISHLIESNIAKRDIAKSARKTVERNFDINNKFSLWVNAYKEITSCQFQATRR